jgi:hypothetical protein
LIKEKNFCKIKRWVTNSPRRVRRSTSKMRVDKTIIIWYTLVTLINERGIKND